MSLAIHHFLSASDEEQLIEAIRKAESNTSGEIRIHIEKNSPIEDTFERAMDVFHNLKMDNTKLQNGVLIYVAIEEKSFVIYGDKGINDVVPINFWDETRDVIVSHFKKGHYKDGLVAGVLNAGEQLEKFFPWEEAHGNELSNEISKG
ncbi:MAG: hypothetical protein BM564_00980 [Bacteroidetes bacterium MedPE-SWsnd-G2]|nr:MAG: hypothetical protein BM564_00980 [Bacteroidetes bacterium MedPE-SWsnd-G2]